MPTAQYQYQYQCQFQLGLASTYLITVLEYSLQLTAFNIALNQRPLNLQRYDISQNYFFLEAMTSLINPVMAFFFRYVF